jgi:hypothetical protein
MQSLLGKGSAPVFSCVSSRRLDCLSLPVSVQFCSAMLACDVDGDGCNELVLGGDDGDLCIVKDSDATVVARELGVVRFVVDVRLHDRLTLIAAVSCDGELRVLSMHSLTRLLRLHKALLADPSVSPAALGSPDAADALVTLCRRTVADSPPTAIYVKPCGELGARDLLHADLQPFDRSLTSLLYVATDTRTVSSFAIGLVAGRLECRELDTWLVPFDVVAVAPLGSMPTSTVVDDGSDDVSGALAMYHPALFCILAPSTPTTPARTILPTDLVFREAAVVRTGPVIVVVPHTRSDVVLGSATNRQQLRAIYNRTRICRVDLPAPDQTRAVHLGRFSGGADLELAAVCLSGVVYLYDRNQNLRRATLHQPLRCSTAGELSILDPLTNTRRNATVLAVVNVFNELSVFQFD